MDRCKIQCHLPKTTDKKSAFQNLQSYSLPVRTHDWQVETESLPKDYNHRDSGNMVLSTYRQLGHDPTWRLPQPTTQEGLEQPYRIARETIPSRTKDGLLGPDSILQLTALDRYDSKKILQELLVSKKTSFASTYHNDYKAPHGKLLETKELKVDKTEWDKLSECGIFRKCKSSLTETTSHRHRGTHKFQDDCDICPYRRHKIPA